MLIKLSGRFEKVRTRFGAKMNFQIFRSWPVSKFPPLEPSLTFLTKCLGLSPRTKKTYCSESRLLRLLFIFFTLGIAEPGPKSEFGQTSTENECPHY